MNNILPVNTMSTQSTEMATIQGGFGREFMVQSTRGAYRATLAFSCLVKPEIGDSVLVNAGDKESHILAIIDRPTNKDITMAFQGDVSMQAKSGKIDLVSHEEVGLTSAKKINMVSTELGINTAKANVQATELSVSGDKVVSRWRDVHSFSSAMNMITERLIQRIKNSFKTVEGVDQLTSQNYLQTVGKTMSVRSRDSVITARKDMKIDGERIHMG